MLWDIIRDFIVEHLTGGTMSDGSTYGGYVGFNSHVEFEDGFRSNDIFYNIGNSYGNEFPVYISLGDWLSTTITAVIMLLLVVFAVWLVRWIFKAVSSAFLLK